MKLVVRKNHVKKRLLIIHNITGKVQ